MKRRAKPLCQTKSQSLLNSWIPRKRMGKLKIPLSKRTPQRTNLRPALLVVPPLLLHCRSKILQPLRPRKMKLCLRERSCQLQDWTDRPQLAITSRTTIDSNRTSRIITTTCRINYHLESRTKRDKTSTTTNKVRALWVTSRILKCRAITTFSNSNRWLKDKVSGWEVSVPC